MHDTVTTDSAIDAPGCNSPTLIAPAQSEQRYAIGVPSGTVSVDGKLTE